MPANGAPARRPDALPGSRPPEMANPMRKKKSPVKDLLLTRYAPIADGIAALPPLTSRYTRIALTTQLRRLIDEGTAYGLALEGISAADVARTAAAQA